MTFPDLWAVVFLGTDVAPVLYRSEAEATAHAADWLPDVVRVVQLRLVPVEDAAPDLLAALRDLLAVTPATAPGAGAIVGAEQRHRAAIEAARAAIAKAEGKA